MAGRGGSMVGGGSRRTRGLPWEQRARGRSALAPAPKCQNADAQRCFNFIFFMGHGERAHSCAPPVEDVVDGFAYEWPVHHELACVAWRRDGWEANNWARRCMRSRGHAATQARVNPCCAPP